MFVTFTRCDWRGGSRRLIKAAGMLIGRGHCCPLCSALSYWASVAPVKGQRTDLKSVTLTSPSHTHALPHAHMYTTYPTYTPSVRPLPFFLLGFSFPLLKKIDPFASLISSMLLNQVVGACPPPHWVWSSVGGVILSQFFFSLSVFLLWPHGRLHFQSGWARRLCACVLKEVCIPQNNDKKVFLSSVFGNVEYRAQFQQKWGLFIIQFSGSSLVSKILVSDKSVVSSFIPK